MAMRRAPLLASLLLFVSIWVLVIGLRTSGHFPKLSWPQNPSPPPPPLKPSEITPLDSHASVSELNLRLEALIQQEKNIERQKADLAQREKALETEQRLIGHDSYSPSPHPKAPRSLISYVYTESPTNRRNLEFFVAHGLYADVDFVFSFNGDTDADLLLPSHPNSTLYDPSVKNIEIVRRDNKCLDFGAHSEILLREWPEKDGKGDAKMVGKGLGDRMKLVKMGSGPKGGKPFWKGYERFMLMNASVRGPFMPFWSKTCWSDAFWGLMNEKTKLVGMAYNCHEGHGHVQSMVWGLDRIGLGLLLQPYPTGVGYWCPYDMVDAISGEVLATPLITNAGYAVDALDAVYHSHDGDDNDNDGKKDNSPEGYLKGCTDEDFFHENYYYGFNIHPYEVVFMKAAREMQEVLLGNLTLWTDGSGYSSYDVCDGRPKGQVKVVEELKHKAEAGESKPTLT